MCPIYHNEYHFRGICIAFAKVTSLRFLAYEDDCDELRSPKTHEESLNLRRSPACSVNVNVNAKDSANTDDAHVETSLAMIISEMLKMRLVSTT